jgi:hypothetical protein
MSRSLHKLSARRVETVSTPGWHSDGGGLYLRLGKDGSKRWTFAWERDKRRREMGLGAFANVSLAMARERAAVARAQLADGLDPIEERRAAEEAERASRSADTPTGGGESKQAAFADASKSSSMPRRRRSTSPAHGKTRRAGKGISFTCSRGNAGKRRSSIMPRSPTSRCRISSPVCGGALPLRDARLH